MHRIFLAATAALLAATVGWPLPQAVPRLQQLQDAATSALPGSTIVKVLACGAWLAWAHFTACVLAEVRGEIRQRIIADKKLQALVPRARQLAQAAAGASLQQAAAQQGLTVQQTGMFTRGSLVPGLGQYTEAVGAAFGVAQGAVTAPVVSPELSFAKPKSSRIMSPRVVNFKLCGLMSR